MKTNKGVRAKGGVGASVGLCGTKGRHPRVSKVVKRQQTIGAVSGQKKDFRDTKKKSNV